MRSCVAFLLLAIVAAVAAQRLSVKVYNTGANCQDSAVFSSLTFVGECVRVTSLSNSALMRVTARSGSLLNVTTYYGTDVSTCDVPPSGGVTKLDCTVTLGVCAFCQFQLLYDNAAVIATAAAALSTFVAATVLML